MLNEVLEEYFTKAPKAMDVLTRDFEDSISVLDSLKNIGKTSNKKWVKEFNEEIH